jgi:hypothetical protein
VDGHKVDLSGAGVNLPPETRPTGASDSSMAGSAIADEACAVPALPS